MLIIKKIGIESILDRVSCNDENVLEMIGKVHNLKTDPRVRHISLRPPVQWHDGVGPQTEPYVSKGFILSEYLIHTQEPLSIKEQEAILKKYKLPKPIAKPDHYDFSLNPFKAGFYFRNDDWIQIFIVRFCNFKILT